MKHRIFVVVEAVSLQSCYIRLCYRMKIWIFITTLLKQQIKWRPNSIKFNFICIVFLTIQDCHKAALQRIQAWDPLRASLGRQSQGKTPGLPPYAQYCIYFPFILFNDYSWMNECITISVFAHLGPFTAHPSLRAHAGSISKVPIQKNSLIVDSLAN